MGRCWRRAALLCLLAMLCRAARASEGDQRWPYRGCVYHCTEGTGASDAPRSPLCAASSARPPLVLRLLAWDCEADCRYRCMWRIEDGAAGEGGGGVVSKYHGKWPFVRALGMQEPASVAASLANAAAHAAALSALRRVPGPRAAAYASHASLSVAAWLASAAFHARDTPPTERADYFAAGAVVLAGVYVTALRTLRWLDGRAGARGALAAALAAVYAARVRAMLTVRFDYGGWVAACLALGAVQTTLWLRWALATREGRRHPGRGSLLLFIGALNAASLLEILDFPPVLAVLDAHATWHLATIPLWALWYGFVLRDVEAREPTVQHVPPDVPTLVLPAAPLVPAPI